DTRPREEASSGTPHFMSPEQFVGHWRDYGPSTDLYAVGCVAHLLATGRLPFSGDNALQLALSHINQPPPNVDRELQLPTGFDDWLHRLLAKDPRQRYQRAADAGWLLLTIAESHQKHHPQTPDAETWVFQPNFLLDSKKGALARNGTAAIETVVSEPTTELD